MWGHQIGRLQQEDLFYRMKIYLGCILSFRVGGGSRSVRLSDTFHKFYLVVTRMLGQIQRLIVNGH